MNWKSFKSLQSKKTKKDKGDAFELLVKVYLQNSPNYTNKLKHVWLLNEVPASVHAYLNLPRPDKGIDLICETSEGEYWAVQAKYHHDEQTNQTWRSLSTFTGLAFGLCKNISYGLVCTTANSYGKLFETADNIGFISGATWRGLDNQYFDLLSSRKRKVVLEPFSPYPYQEPAVKKAKKHFKNNKNGILIMPCGSGKSLTAYWIAKSINPKVMVVALPSLYLVKQTFEVWMREIAANKQKYLVHIVCSDATTAKIDEDSEIKTNIQDFEVPVNTDINEIAKWLKKNKNKRIIIFTTYQSGSTLSKAVKKANTEIDFGIFDEAHKTAGKKDKSFAYLLQDKNIKMRKRMFMTATEKYFPGESDTVASMDDVNLYGESFHKLEFREAIEMSAKMDRPILSDYRLHTINIEQSELEELVKRNVFVRPKDKTNWNKDLEARFLISVIALRKAIKKLGINHTVSFHSSRAKARAFKESQDKFSSIFSEYEPLKSDFIDGKYPASQRKQLLDKFINDEKALLTNAKCLTEGIDVPKIDCVLFADPKQSKIDIVQAMGRALRYYKGKKYGYILLPIVLYNANDSRKENQYNQILKIIRHLASHDSRIIEYFKAKSEGKDPGDPPVIIDQDFDSNEVDINEINEQIHTRGWQETAKLSWMPFKEARGTVRAKNFKNVQAYWHWEERPLDIPFNPHINYKLDGWISWEDWLGKEITYAKNTLGLLESKQWMHKNNRINPKTGEKFINSQNMFIKWGKISRSRNGKKKLQSLGLPKDFPLLPLNISTNVKKFYDHKDWKGMPDFCGYYREKYEYMSFKDSRSFVHKLGLKRRQDWADYVASKEFPSNLHKFPKKKYAKEWVRWGDWLGNFEYYSAPELQKIYKTIPYEKAEKFARGLKLKAASHYKDFVASKLKIEGISCPIWLAKAPDRFYKNSGWVSWQVYLGNHDKTWDYKQSSDFIKKLEIITSRDKYHAYLRGEYKELPIPPKQLPKHPHITYRDEWKNGGWYEFTGKEKPKYIPIPELKKILIKNSIKTITKYEKFSSKKGNESIPYKPYNAYKNDGWTGWEDLGIPSPKKRVPMLEFNEARIFARKLKLKSNKEWLAFARGELKVKGVNEKPNNIPINAHTYYKNKGWISYPDFLGYSD